ncbi:MAG: hypothetical protein LUG19_12790, partial [Desulfovibrio sp.]|uniref:hypothetical protein n=1 Tax=Desulfovibrio sp. TaxID=885 RepID=UPI00258C788A
MRFAKPWGRDRSLMYRYLNARAGRGKDPDFVYSLRIGTRKLRLVSYAADYAWHVRNQLEYILLDEPSDYDATFVVWQEKDFAALVKDLHLVDKTSEPYRRYRIDQMRGADIDLSYFEIFDEERVHGKPLLEIRVSGNQLVGWNPRTNTYYYAVRDLAPEELIKQGHLFRQLFSRFFKGPQSNLAHGAVVGLNNTGVLLCGMGNRGKSTLSVSALLDDFDYVSDDYLLLERIGGILRASPIYSIITLSSQIWQQLPSRMNAAFVSNNARKDKYVFNIGRYHHRFVSEYPVRLCMSLNIRDCLTPSIEPGYKAHALDEFVYSSIMQTGDARDISTICKLASFVNDLPFYRINLSRDLAENTRCLREFLEHFN